MATLIIILAMIFVLGPIAKAYADRLSHGLPADADAQRQELGRMREELDRLSIEVARLEEEQRFLLRLLDDGDRRKLLDDPTDRER